MQEFKLHDYYQKTENYHLTEAGAELVIQYLNLNHGCNIDFPIAGYTYTELCPHDALPEITSPTNPVWNYPPMKPQPLYCSFKDEKSDKEMLSCLFSQIPKTLTDYRKAFVIYLERVPSLLVYVREKNKHFIYYYHSDNQNAKHFATLINQTVGWPVFYKGSKARVNSFEECINQGEKLTGSTEGHFNILELIPYLHQQLRQGALQYIHKDSEHPPRSLTFWDRISSKEHSKEPNIDKKTYPQMIATQYVVNKLTELRHPDMIQDYVLKSEQSGEVPLAALVNNFLKSVSNPQREIVSSVPTTDTSHLGSVDDLAKKYSVSSDEQSDLQKQIQIIKAKSCSGKMRYILLGQEASFFKLLQSCKPNLDLFLVSLLLKDDMAKLTVEFWFKVANQNNHYADLILENNALIQQLSNHHLLYYWGHRSTYLVRKILDYYPDLLNIDEKIAFQRIKSISQAESGPFEIEENDESSTCKIQ